MCVFIELTIFKSLFFSEVPSFYFGSQPTFARKTFLQKRLCEYLNVVSKSCKSGWAFRVGFGLKFVKMGRFQVCV